MTFKGAFWISVLAQRQQFLVAPLVFLWLLGVHAILGIDIAPITALLIGMVIAAYQQFSITHEDILDGFYDHCRFNGVSSLSYAFAKFLSVWLTTLFPMALLLVLFGFELITAVLITMQWMLLNTCIACLMIFIPISNHKANPLNLLLAWLPLLIAPIIFLIDYLQYYNKNSLLILLGCDIIIVCTVFLPFYFNRLKV